MVDFNHTRATPAFVARDPYSKLAANGIGISTKVLSVAALVLGLLAWAIFEPLVATVLLRSFQISIVTFALWRVVVIFCSRRREVVASEDPQDLPRYTVMAALYDEARILPQLVNRLSLLDYPRDRLEGFILLEAKDADTIAVARGLSLPDWLKVVIVPEGSPQTKPRALNYGLDRASGELLTIYDAEDAPDPQQLREAAARFADGPSNLACLQAPLRIRREHRPVVMSPILDRQFAAEYAGLFEVVLPGMARLGLPFPLGGTSNHFRVPALRKVGGWDAYNVTEDADLGFRFWRHGWTLGVMSAPTWETPPGPLKLWLPQRTRWLKGYLQTIAVHAFGRGLGWRGSLGMLSTLFAGLLAASVHGYAMAGIGALLFLGLLSLQTPQVDPVTLFVTFAGFAASWATSWVGARRIGIPYGLREIAVAPFYWCLLTLAFAHAICRLVLQPHAWDKTPHLPDIAVPDLHTPVIRPRYSRAKAGRRAA